MKNILSYFLRLFLLALLPASLYSQACCGRIDLPLGSLENGVSSSNRGQIVLNYQFTSFEREEPPKYGWKVLNGRDHMIFLSISLPVSGTFSMDLFLPYAKRNEKVDIGDEIKDRRTKGIGDPIALLKWTPFKGFISLSNLFIPTLAMGIKLPVGGYRDKDELGPLPRTFQVGTGSFDLISALYLYESWNPDWILLLSSILRLNGTNDENFQLGNSLRTTVRLNYLKFSPLGIAFGLRYWHWGMDKFQGLWLKDSGGFEFSSLLSLFYNFWRISLLGELDFPLYRNLYGNQMARKIGLSLGLSKGL